MKRQDLLPSLGLATWVTRCLKWHHNDWSTKKAHHPQMGLQRPLVPGFQAAQHGYLVLGDSQNGWLSLWFPSTTTEQIKITHPHNADEPSSKPIHEVHPGQFISTSKADVRTHLPLTFACQVSSYAGNHGTSTVAGTEQ